MSFRRKEYDGDLFGGNISHSEWGDSFSGKSKTGKHAATNRAKKNSPLLTEQYGKYEGDAEKDRYLITYADVITLLLGLFIILYAISNIDLQKYEKIKIALDKSFGGSTAAVIGISDKVPEINVQPVDELKNKLATLIVQNDFGKYVQLEENERGITIHILEEILFSSGSADLSQGSLSMLNKISAVLIELPNDIRIEGHTDNVPISSGQYRSNWHLSVARALNTAYYLISSQRINPERVSIVGFSEYKPIASNETVSGRAHNRRVDIVILRES